MKCFLILLIFTGFSTYSQVKITGQVMDNNNVPVRYATLHVDGKNSTATTVDLGTFLMTLNNSKIGDVITLKVSKKGYQTTTQLITISPKSEFIRLIKLHDSNGLTKSKNKLENDLKTSENNNQTTVNGNSNQTTIGGNNNRTLIGNNNHDIFFGDIILNKEKMLSNDDLEKLFVKIKELQKSKARMLTIDMCDYTNAPLIRNQIVSYFKTKGTEFTMIGTAQMVASAPIVQRIEIQNLPNEINILVGHFD